MIHGYFMRLIKNKPFTIFLAAAALIAIVLAVVTTNRPPSQTTLTDADLITPTLSRAPQTIEIPNSPLKISVIAAGDFLARQQLPNGEISYQVDVLTEAREYSPSYIRLIAGTGALFTVCRVSGSEKYCDAGDLALDHYLERIITDAEHFQGACFYTSGTCQLGGSALAVDAIYKRWQVTGDFKLGENNLAAIAEDLGYFIVSMRKPEGGFYHAFDPHYAGTVDPDNFVIYSLAESLLALLEL